MSTPILATKLYIPPPRPNVVIRPRLLAGLNEGLTRKLTLISAPAGFGKTTLVSGWVATCDCPIAWVSLDDGDNDPARFMAYVIAALQTLMPHLGDGVLRAMQSPQPPAMETILTALVNEIITIPHEFALVLDDYHLIESTQVDDVLTFLIEHLPPHMHMIVATREDPIVPLARLRARNQLTELRARELRFTPAEAAEFFNQVIGLHLSEADIIALDTRTEGWIAGLQLAAISMQGHQEPADFIKSFTGSHHFVLDYLLEEVLHQQSERLQTFLLRTSILDRMCGSLCDAVIGMDDAQQSGQVILEHLEHANLFIVPLDNERRWYRYHHLFADLLRQRLQHNLATVPTDGLSLDALHIRASDWYEANGLELEAFHHATAAHDIDRAARLIEGKGLPLHFRGGAVPIINWLKTLPPHELDARPALWVTFASCMLFISTVDGIEQKLQSAEKSLQHFEPDAKIRDLIGHIAVIRATVAVTQHDAQTILAQSRRALEFLHPDNLPVRTATTWTLGYAHHLHGERSAAMQAYTQALSISQQIGHHIITIMSSIGLGNMQEMDNHLTDAQAIYRRVLEFTGDPPMPIACQPLLGLAHIAYQRNDLEAAQNHAEQALQLAEQIANTDRVVACQVFIARLKLAQGDVDGARMLLSQSEKIARQHGYLNQLPDIITMQVRVALHEDDLEEAAALIDDVDLPLSQARILLAQGEISSALSTLEAFRDFVEAKGWHDERLKGMILQALANYQQDNADTAINIIADVLMQTQSEGFIRLFVDEGLPMAHLLADVALEGILPDYIATLIAAIKQDKLATQRSTLDQPLMEPLSERELEVLQLIADGLSNQEICDRLFLALNTVKGHNQKIFGKLQVQRRTEAVARARVLGLIAN